jgi:hypothetical protein
VQGWSSNNKKRPLSAKKEDDHRQHLRAKTNGATTTWSGGTGAQGGRLRDHEKEAEAVIELEEAITTVVRGRGNGAWSPERE